ncbi:hypothetical protein [uncultured Pseudodesulfovibrio sp.]|uniref:hypothetical protein n=1 Tax=uncultured Pseudodesulfovibrio sp. TaxID=2035858 RepID=UPI0037482710
MKPRTGSWVWYQAHSPEGAFCLLFAAPQKAGRRKGETFAIMPFAPSLRMHAMNPPKKTPPPLLHFLIKSRFGLCFRRKSSVAHARFFMFIRLTAPQGVFCHLFVASQKAGRRKGETFAKIPFELPLRTHAIKPYAPSFHFLRLKKEPFLRPRTHFARSKFFHKNKK